MALKFISVASLSSLFTLFVAIAPSSSFADVVGGVCLNALSRVASILKPMQWVDVPGVGSLPEFEDEGLPYRRVFLTDATIATARSALTFMPAASQPAKAFEVYLEARMSGYPLWIKQKIINLVQSTRTKSSYVLRGVTNQETSRITLFAPEILVGSVAYYQLLAHEMEHAIQRVEVKAGLTFKKRERYEREFGAVRAEWEFLKLVPDDTTRAELTMVEASTLRASSKDLVARSLRGAGVSFADYRAAHGFSSRQAVEAFYCGEWSRGS